MLRESLERGNEILKSISILQNIAQIIGYPWVEFKCNSARADLGDCDKVTRDKVALTVRACIEERIKELEKEFAEL